MEGGDEQYEGDRTFNPGPFLEQEAYVHKVKAASVLDLSRPSHDSTGMSFVSQDYGHVQQSGPGEQAYAHHQHFPQFQSVQGQHAGQHIQQSSDIGEFNKQLELSRDRHVVPPIQEEANTANASQFYKMNPLNSEQSASENQREQHSMHLSDGNHDQAVFESSNTSAFVQNPPVMQRDETDVAPAAPSASSADVSEEVGEHGQSNPTEDLAEKNAGTSYPSDADDSSSGSDDESSSSSSSSSSGDEDDGSDLEEPSKEIREDDEDNDPNLEPSKEDREDDFGAEEVKEDDSGKTKQNIATEIPITKEVGEDDFSTEEVEEDDSGKTNQNIVTEIPVTKEVGQDDFGTEEVEEDDSGKTNQNIATEIPVTKIEPEDVVVEQGEDTSLKTDEVVEIQPKQENEEDGDENTARQTGASEKAASTTEKDTTEQEDFVTVSWYQFKCKFCAKNFQDRKGWKSHLVKEHGVKPYVCMYCDERFEKKGLLKEHHRLHEMGRVPDKVQEKEIKVKAKPQGRAARKRAAPKLKIIITEDAPKRKRGRPPAKSAAGGKKKKIVAPKRMKIKKENDPEFLPSTDVSIEAASDTGRNKRKRGPVFRYVAESGDSPTKRTRKKVAKTFPCSQCPKSFTTDKARIVHEKTHQNWKCADCGEYFKLKRELKQHKANAHSEESTAKIKPLKSKNKREKDDEQEGEESSESEKEEGDSDKDYEAESSDNEDDGEQIGPFKCKFCPREIKKRKNLAKHERTHENGAPHTCPHCQKVYTRRRDLRRHMVRHTDEKPYQCDKCKKRFKHDVGLRRHMRLHTGEGLLVCQFCGKKYNGKGSLKAHERIHTGEKPYKCAYCEKHFGTQTAQKYHEIEHTGAMICSQCGRQFKSKHNLQEHERIHTGQKPYKCGRCDMTFMSVGARRYHMNIHTESEHRCEICKKIFTCKSSLDAHKFIHTGLHPWGCKFCPKHFNSLSGVRGHERQVHLGRKRKHKTKAQKVLEKALIAQKKVQANRDLTKKELKEIADTAKTATLADQPVALRPGRKPRADKHAAHPFKHAKAMPQDYSSNAEHKDVPVTQYAVDSNPKEVPSSSGHQPLHSSIPNEVQYPTHVIIGDPGTSSSGAQSMPVDYTATYVSSALQKAIGLMPRGVHNNPQAHAHSTPWPSQHVGNSHLDTMVESLVQFSKNY